MKRLLAIKAAILLNALFAFSQKAIEFARLEVAEVFKLAERHDGSRYNLFRGGILPRTHAFVNELLDARL